LGGAAYVNSQNQDEREAEERLKKIAHEKEKEQHRLDKEQHKHDKEVHKHDKALAAHEKDEHRLAKEHEKEQARLIKEQHQREKELGKENEGEEKKKGGLLGFLHRDKSKKGSLLLALSLHHASLETTAPGTPGTTAMITQTRHAGRASTSCTRTHPRAIPRVKLWSTSSTRLIRMAP